MTHDRFSPYYLHQRHSSIPSFNVTDRMQPNSISLGQVWEREAQTNPAQTVDIEERIENLDGVDERTLIKEELRLSIQSRRIARGLPGNVEIEYKKPLAEVGWLDLEQLNYGIWKNSSLNRRDKDGISLYHERAFLILQSFSQQTSGYSCSLFCVFVF